MSVCRPHIYLVESKSPIPMDGERMMTRCAGRFTPAASVEVATSTLSFFVFVFRGEACNGDERQREAAAM